MASSSSSRQPITPPLSPVREAASPRPFPRAPGKCSHKPVARKRRSSRPAQVGAPSELATRVEAIDIARSGAGVVPPVALSTPGTQPTPPNEKALAKPLAAQRKPGKDHSGCTLRCGVKRALLMDSRLCGENGEVPVRVHMSPDLFEPGFAPQAFTTEPMLHVHHCPLAEAYFLVALDLVRQFLPSCSDEIGRKLHSIYTLNHPYGRGTPHRFGAAEVDDAVWRRWLGCPQALQCHRADPASGRSRVWLVDGRAEVLVGAEVSGGSPSDGRC